MMKVDIWSDIRCPFCYIGKRKFEMALDQFEHKDKVKVEWHSFELDPNMKTQTDVNVYDYLAEIKGQTREWAVEMHDHVTQTASEVGLDFNFDDSVMANSFDGHRLIQLAKSQGLGDAAEERLFKAYFTEGANISDHATLVKLGSEIGLKSEDVEEMLNSKSYADDVRKDEAKAQTIGIRGVPFFILNDQYSVSGAQAPQTFLQGLLKSWDSYLELNPAATAIADNSGDSCEVGGDC